MKQNGGMERNCYTGGDCCVCNLIDTRAKEEERKGEKINKLWINAFLCASYLCKYFAIQWTVYNIPYSVEGYRVRQAWKKANIFRILPHFHSFCIKLAVFVVRMLVPFIDAQISYRIVKLLNEQHPFAIQRTSNVECNIRIDRPINKQAKNVEKRSTPWMQFSWGFFSVISPVV